MSATQKRINGLIAAYEWLGTYEGDDGSIADGGTEGVPQDMLDGYAELRRQINALYAEMAIRSIARKLVEQVPNADPVKATRLARKHVQENRDKFPQIGESS